MLKLSERDNCVILVNSLGMGGGEKVALTIAQSLNLKILTLEKNSFYNYGNVTSLSPLPDCFPVTMHRLVSFVNFPIYIIRNKVAVVKSHLLVSNILNAFFSLFIGYKSIIVQHSNIDTHIKRPIIGRLIKSLFKACHCMVCISKEMLTDASKKIPDVNAKLIYNPHDIENITIKSFESVEVPSDFYVVVGRLFKGKRVSDIITAFSKVDINEKCLIIGDGDERTILENLVLELGLEDKIVFLGAKDNPYPYMKKAKATILASESEGFPNCLVESLALGVPLISSNCKSGPSELLETDLRNGDEFKKTSTGYMYNVGDINALSQILSIFDCNDFSESLLKSKSHQFSIKRVIDDYKFVIK
ncbi:glycosyltransferase [Parasalinivibrio latis]|uniref:glycosyltransferase n=1 Tax=Parasalinivibrio latis TaxID=2952610 RepID=UPI0030E4FD72